MDDKFINKISRQIKDGKPVPAWVAAKLIEELENLEQQGRAEIYKFQQRYLGLFQELRNQIADLTRKNAAYEKMLLLEEECRPQKK